MFCIAAFIVLGILAIFSASYRPLAAKAWHCVLRRVTLRPCDIDFSQEMKAKLIGKLVFTRPRLARFLSRWIEWLSFAFVALSIWSLLTVANAGLNLWVYDTCYPQNAESCSLGGEACGVAQQSLGLIQAVREGRVAEWAIGPFTRFIETVSRIPDRLKTWDPQDYLGPSPSFYAPRDDAKPYALEIVDPGCHFCKKLTGNLVAAGVTDQMNVSYLLYPIPVGATGATKFPHSTLVASVIEAAKTIRPAAGTGTLPPDWQLIELLFADLADGSVDLQTRMNIAMTRADAERTLRELLSQIGYAPEETDRVMARAQSQDVARSLAEQKRVVEEDVRTIKIPTLLINGRRYDRVVDPEKLRRIADRTEG